MNQSIKPTKTTRPQPTQTDQLRSIIARHKTDYDARDHDYHRGRKLIRGSPEHAAAFRRAPQWYWHLGIGPNGRKASYLDLIRTEARQTVGPDGGEAVEALL